MVVGKQAMRTVQLCIQVRKSSFTALYLLSYEHIGGPAPEKLSSLGESNGYTIQQQQNVQNFLGYCDCVYRVQATTHTAKGRNVETAGYVVVPFLPEKSSSVSCPSRHMLA